MSIKPGLEEVPLIGADEANKAVEGQDTAIIKAPVPVVQPTEENSPKPPVIPEINIKPASTDVKPEISKKPGKTVSTPVVGTPDETGSLGNMESNIVSSTSNTEDEK